MADDADADGDDDDDVNGGAGRGAGGLAPKKGLPRGLCSTKSSLENRRAHQKPKIWNKFLNRLRQFIKPEKAVY